MRQQIACHTLLAWDQEVIQVQLVTQSFFLFSVRYHRRLFKIGPDLPTHRLRQYIVGPTTHPPSSLRGGIRLRGASAMRTLPLPLGHSCLQAGGNGEREVLIGLTEQTVSHFYFLCWSRPKMSRRRGPVARSL